MVCLLLQGFTAAGKVKDEVGCNIQHTLLQAFCAESRISIVRVLASADLMRLVGQLAGKMEIKASDGCCQEASPTDCSLLVIEVRIVIMWWFRPALWTLQINHRTSFVVACFFLFLKAFSSVPLPWYMTVCVRSCCIRWILKICACKECVL